MLRFGFKVEGFITFREMLAFGSGGGGGGGGGGALEKIGPHPAAYLYLQSI